MSFQFPRGHYRQALFIPRSKVRKKIYPRMMIWSFLPQLKREIDLIMERQNKRARGQSEVGKEYRTPPYPRAARVARASIAVPSSQGEECGGDDDPITTRQGTQPTQPIPMHLVAYHPPLSYMMPQKFQSGMMLNLHLGTAMSSLPILPPKAWGDLGPKSIYNHVYRVIRSGIMENVYNSCYVRRLRRKSLKIDDLQRNPVFFNSRGYPGISRS